jgi:hypothetical protein
MGHWMINCKEFSRLACQSMDRELPLATRLSFRFHQLMCRHCARFHEQLHTLRDACHIETGYGSGAHPSDCLSVEVRNRIKTLLQDSPE